MRIELSDRKPNEYKIDRERERDLYHSMWNGWERERESESGRQRSVTKKKKKKEGDGDVF